MASTVPNAILQILSPSVLFLVGLLIMRNTSVETARERVR